MLGSVVIIVAFAVVLLSGSVVITVDFPASTVVVLLGAMVITVVSLVFAVVFVVLHSNIVKLSIPLPLVLVILTGMKKTAVIIITSLAMITVSYRELHS